MAETWFMNQGAKQCVVIPDPEEVTFDNLLRFVNKANVKTEEGCFVVRIVDGQQDALTMDELKSRLRKPSIRR